MKNQPKTMKNHEKSTWNHENHEKNNLVVIVTVVGSAESVPASAEPRQSHNTTFFIFIHLLQELQVFV